MELRITNSRKWLTLFITTVSTFMATLDGSIVNIALPVLSTRLHESISSVQWVVTAYLLTISVLLLIWGKFSDLYGKKWIFASGFLVFALGSALCGMSHTLEFLVISRVIQAIGASAMMSLSQGIVTAIFPASERGRALGIVGTMVAVGSLVGPSLGGVLVNYFSWESIFYINVPIGVVGAVLAFTIIPDVFETLEHKVFDYKGAGLFSLSLLSLFVGLLFVQEGMLPVIYLIPSIAVAAITMWLFIYVERRSEHPLIDLKLFKVHEFSFGLVSAFLCFIALSSTLLFMPFYLQDLLGLNPLWAGLLISFYPITTAIVSPISGWLSDKITYRPLTVIGMALAAVGLLVMTTLTQSSSHVIIALLMIVLGAGIAIFQSPNNSSVMGSVPRQQLGIAGGINALFRNLGMVSGTAFSVMIFSFATKLNINTLTGKLNAGTFLKGFDLILIFDAVCCLIALGISLMRTVAIKPTSVNREST
jgi:EmrB/QacA subfamily drug resistance transporter